MFISISDMDLVVFGELSNEPLRDLMNILIEENIIKRDNVVLLDKAKV